MLDPENTAPPCKILVIALMDPDTPPSVPDPLPASSTAFVVDAGDPASLVHLVQELRHGRTPHPGSAKQIRITMHEDDRLEEDPGLSPREQDVLCGLVRGLSYKMIANELDISFETVRSHIKGLYGKLNVNNNTAAVARAIHAGYAAA